MTNQLPQLRRRCTLYSRRVSTHARRVIVVLTTCSWMALGEPPPAIAQEIDRAVAPARPCAVAVEAPTRIDAPEIWHEALRRSQNHQHMHRFATGAGVKVAVIDTGVAQHPRLTPLSGPDFVLPDSPQPTVDCDAHGTAVASIIGLRHGADGLVGIAPDADIISIRQTSAHYRSEQQESAGNLTSLADAIHAALDADARLINISVVSCVPATQQAYLDLTPLRDAVDRAEAEGAVIIAASGNASPQCTPGDMVLPAHLPTVISVGAVDPAQKGTADYSLPSPPDAGLYVSSIGSAPLVASPSGHGLSHGTAGDGEIHSYNGTSFAAPVITGTLALLVQRYPEITPDQLRRLVHAAADDSRGEIDPQALLSTIETKSATRNATAVEVALARTTDRSGARLALLLGCGLLLISIGAIARGWLSSVLKR